MLPLWIIDLGSADGYLKRIRALLDGLSESQRPFWHYTHPTPRQVKDAAGVVTLMNELVSDGQNCYNDFIQAGYPVDTFQITVMGAADEHLSQAVFAPLAGLLRDALPRIVSAHANLGVEITGILYIPSKINQLGSVDERRDSAMLLEEINLLCSPDGPKHYNRIVAYQDVQYQKGRFYPGLDENQRTDLLFQILSNLYLVSEDSQKLFDAIGKGCGIYSLGAASIYYSSEQHQQFELRRLLEKLISEFKEPEERDEDYSDRMTVELLDAEVFHPDAVSSRLRERCDSLDIDLHKIDSEANPHPVWELFLSDLFPAYYHKYLKYMPARLISFLESLSYVLKSRFSVIIRRNREDAAKSFRHVIKGFYRNVFQDDGLKYATIAQMESVFEKAKQRLEDFRVKADKSVQEIVPIPRYLRHDYDKCVMDEEANKPSLLMEKLKKSLKKEPIVLSLLVRCFLLGFLLVFTAIPLMRVLSPNVINLGEIATIEWVWIPFFFLLPLIVNFFIRLRRHFKRIKRIKMRMLAATILAANKQLTSLLLNEIDAFYNSITEECEAQHALLGNFREVLVAPEVPSGSKALPETFFNQPLLGGSFCGKPLVTSDEDVSEAEIRVKDEKTKISSLEKEDVLLLLKAALKDQDVLTGVVLSDGREINEHNSDLIVAWKAFFKPQLHIHTAEDAGAMLCLLGDKANTEVLRLMAGVNGMLFSKIDNNAPVVRVSNPPEAFRGMRLLTDRATRDYVMMTSWQEIRPGIQSTQVCNCSLDQRPKLGIGEMLTLYYAYYKRKDLSYTLAGIPIDIPKADMDKLNKQLGG